MTSLPLDLPTLLLVAITANLFVALLMLTSWLGHRGARELGWWALAFGMSTLGFVLLTLRSSHPAVTIVLGNAVITIALGAGYGGVRVLNDRPVSPAILFGGALAWLCACLTPAIYEDVDRRIMVASVIAGIYAFLSAHEIHRHPNRTISAYVMLVLTISHGVFTLCRIPIAMMAPLGSEAAIFEALFFRLVIAEGVFYTIFSAFGLLSLSKDQSALRQRRLARTDELTGLGNRRDFLERAEGMIQGTVGRGDVLVALLIDLDHFKSINDRFGHQMGDQVLRHFAAIGRAELGADDLLGRLGGEEFGVLLRRPTPRAAAAVAERIRAGFERTCRSLGDGTMSITLSIGVAALDGDGDLDPATALDLADAALYEAKSQGRNRVAVLHRSAMPASPRPAAGGTGDRFRPEPQAHGGGGLSRTAPSP